MRSSKSRSRNKSNRQRTLGNIVNRVFDSSGPEGKVRGTPQQIIEKYLTLARDAQLSNDRVAEQSFLQHAEHYTRLLGEAQREQAERQQNQPSQRDDESGDYGNGNNGNGQHGHRNDRQDRNEQRDFRRDDRRDDRRDERRDDRQPAARAEQQQSGDADDGMSGARGLPPVISSDDAESGPVTTPESAASAASGTWTEAAPGSARESAPEAGSEPAAEPAARKAAAETPSAPRRRSRAASGNDATAAPAPRAPRTRKKPAADAAPQSDKASGE